MNQSLQDQLASWYSHGFLELKRITWQSPASTLEYVLKHEAVHPLSSLDEVKGRLTGHRRAYGFFHQNDPICPVAFIMVAMMADIPGSLQEIEAAPSEQSAPSEKLATAAIFYSISSAQPGTWMPP